MHINSIGQIIHIEGFVEDYAIFDNINENYWQKKCFLNSERKEISLNDLIDSSKTQTTYNGNFSVINEILNLSLEDGRFEEIMLMGIIDDQKKGAELYLSKIHKYSSSNKDKFSPDDFDELFGYYSLFYNAPVGIIIIDNNGKIVDANLTWLAMFGFRDVELAQKEIKNVFDDLCIENKDLIHQQDSGKGYDDIEGHEKLFKRQDGSTFYGNMRSKSITNFDGSVDHLTCFIEDITAKSISREKMRKNEIRHRVVSDLMSDFVYSGIFDDAGDIHIDWVSGSYSDILGYNKKDIENFTCFLRDIIHPDDRSYYTERMRLLNNNHEVINDFRIITKSGEIRWLRDYTRPSRKKNSIESYRFWGAVKDITEIKAATDKVYESEERMRLALQNVPVMLVAFDENSRTLVWNEECERITGYSAKEALGNSNIWNKLIPDDEKRHKLGEIWRKKGAMFRDWEIEVVCKNGDKKYISWTFQSLDRKIPGWDFWGIGYDITEKKSSERKRREMEVRMLASSKQATLGEMAARMGHEINQPLNYISVFLQLLKEDIELDRLDTKNLQENVEDAYASMTRIKTIINHLKIYGRTAPEKCEPIDIADSLKQSLQLLRVTFNMKDIKLMFDISGELPEIYGNKIKLEQVFINIINNSMDALYESDKIEKKFYIKAFKEDDYIVISFKDNGIGIREDIKDKIFEPFYTTKDIGKGTGLGLSIVHGIINEMGGIIDVKSRYGEGTEFLIRLKINSGCDNAKES
ncbi:MAG: PAS domain S-box protein [Candidatus Zixiibacteriota bacterium]